MHDNWDLDGLRRQFLGWLTREEDFRYSAARAGGYLDAEEIQQMLVDRAHELYEQREQQFGSDHDARARARDPAAARLTGIGWTISTRWMSCATGIYLRAYAQHDPVVEYRDGGLTICSTP